MARGEISQIFDALEKIDNSVTKKDVRGECWDLRITCAYRIFRAFDIPRFRLEPANPKGVLDDLLELVNYIEDFPRIDDDLRSLQGNRTGPSSRQDGVELMQYLYGLAWSQLTREQYFDATELFARRLYNSNIDISFLRGAECLDLGTGIARYALAMVQLGARHVVGIDFSMECLEEAKRRLEGSREGQHINLVHGDLYNLPDTQSQVFDFVCANGVIHHLPDPTRGLEVVFNCTRKGGKAFVFVFSKSDSPWWRSIDLMRSLAGPVPLAYAHKILRFYEVPGSKIFNMLDYSYTPIQHRFDRRWFERAVESIGFKGVQLLEGGVIHDSVLRCKLFEADRELYGITEIRYLMEK